MAPEQQTTATASTYLTAGTVEEFRKNLSTVRTRIDAAAVRAGRDPAEIELLPVSKTVPEDRIRLAVEAGCTRLGENKVQEATRKSTNLADLDVDWVVIGHLQTNKARDVAAHAAEFQALDNLRAASALQRRLETADRELDVYVQVNTSDEPQKYGLSPDDVADFLTQLTEFPRLHVRGLMTLAVFSADTELVRACFVRLRELRDRIMASTPELLGGTGGTGGGKLSMGMSGDYEIAVEEGATCVRVGQAIFGARAVPDSHYWPGVTGTE